MDTVTKTKLPTLHVTYQDALNVSTPKSAKPVKSLSFYGLLSAHPALYLSVLNNAPLACGLQEEPVTDVTQHAPSAKTVLMTVNNVFQVGSCTKNDATKTVQKETTRTQ